MKLLWLLLLFTLSGSILAFQDSGTLSLHEKKDMITSGSGEIPSISLVEADCMSSGFESCEQKRELELECEDELENNIKLCAELKAEQIAINKAEAEANKRGESLWEKDLPKENENTLISCKSYGINIQDTCPK